MLWRDQRATTAGKRSPLCQETELIGKLDKVTQEKLKNLAAQRDQIETTLAQLCSCLHFMRESLWPGNEEDVLVNQVEDLTAPFQPDKLEPNTKADEVFSVSKLFFFLSLTSFVQAQG